MTRQPLLDPNRSYTFSNYFELGFTADDLVAELGYFFERKFLTLPQYSNELDRITNLKQRIEEILPYVDLENKATRREMLIAPIIADLIHYSHAKLRIEFSIKVRLPLDFFSSVAVRLVSAKLIKGLTFVLKLTNSVDINRLPIKNFVVKYFISI
ncbi:hypothetical protein L8106_22396 [Lyngbya sp. PCC 8106]|nr:hypothetical protein L8106_22396 [Lyngbya sp. PCC 8106]